MTNAIHGSMTELQLLNYLFQKNSLQTIVLNGITEEHFTTYKDHFKFLSEFYNTYNQLPSKETFQTKFSDSFEWVTVTDPEDYLVSKLKEAKLYRNLIEDYKKLGQLLKDEKSELAVEHMGAIAQKFLKEKSTPCIDLIDNVQVRYESYLERVNNPDKSFVSTGLAELDDVLGGWDLLNESAVICARTGIGKSWWLIILLYKQLNKV